MVNPGIGRAREITRLPHICLRSAYRKSRESGSEGRAPAETATPSGRGVAVGGMTATGAEKIAAEITSPAGPRMGRFRVAAWLLDELNPAVGAFLRTCYVVSAIPDRAADLVEYTAEHPDFWPCAVGPGAPKPPLYHPRVVRSPGPVALDDGSYADVTFTWVVGDPVEVPARS